MLSLVVSASAQFYYGTLKGIVMDKQGATIPGATVTATDVATHITRTALSNGAGEFVFGAGDPGTFDLKVSAPNFQGYTQKGVTVATQQTVTLDATLGAGAASQTLAVSPSWTLIA